MAQTKEEIAAQRKAYRLANKERIAEYNRQYHLDNQAERLAYMAEYRENNPEVFEKVKAEYREKNAEAIAEYQKAWHAANPEANVMHAQKRRARLRQVESEDYTTEQVIARTGGLCHLCLDPIDTTVRKSWHIDHIIPVARGGANVLANVAPAHATCNQRKHAKTGTAIPELLNV